MVFGKYNSVIPDIVFVRKDRLRAIVAKDRFNGAPDLVIEIVSPGSANHARDFNLKRKVYSKFGASEYWIVDCWSRSVIIFRPEDDTLKEVMRVRESDVLESPVFPGLSLKLSDIFTNDFSAFLT